MRYKSSFSALATLNRAPDIDRADTINQRHLVHHTSIRIYLISYSHRQFQRVVHRARCFGFYGDVRLPFLRLMAVETNVI